MASTTNSILQVAVDNEVRAQDPRKPNGHRLVLRDAFRVLLVTLFAAVLCAQFDVSEALFHWTRNYEWVQFDELPSILLAFAFGFIWFSARRYKEAGAMLAKQRLIDVQLSSALAENRRLTQQYLSVQESERKNLARELHDELGQYLNVIKIDAVSIRDRDERTADDARIVAGAIMRNIDHVYAVVTELIRRLRPVGLDDLGLVAAVEHCVEQWRRRLPDTQIVMSTEGDLAGLNEQANLTVYRLIQESLTNIARHAQASRATIHLARSADNAVQSEIVIDIADDGVGTLQHEPKSGFGLVSMRERIAMHGGKFAVLSSPGNGFSLHARVPL